MKKVALILVICLVCSTAFAGIAKVRGEAKVAEIVGQIYSRIKSTEQGIILTYNTAKTYVNANPSQFTGDDKTKIDNLELELLTLKDALIVVEDFINVNFPGISE